jgi:hypothetical protein
MGKYEETHGRCEGVVTGLKHKNIKITIQIVQVVFKWLAASA